MILDQLNNSAVYEALHPLFKQAFDYIKQHDLSQLEPGKIELQGQSLYISIQEPKGKKPEEARLETHAKYIDIQFLISGKERIGWKYEAECKDAQAPYNPEKDITFFNETPTAYADMKPGEFCIFFPGDAHAPCIADAPLKKAVVKVLI